MASCQKCAIRWLSKVCNEMGMSWDQVCRRAAGRRHYNSWRRVRAHDRQRRVLNYWRESKGRRGWQADAAVALGVHRSTITRDVQAFLALIRRDEPCPLCGVRSVGWWWDKPA